MSRNGGIKLLGVARGMPIRVKVRGKGMRTPVSEREGVGARIVSELAGEVIPLDDSERN